MLRAGAFVVCAGVAFFAGVTFFAGARFVGSAVPACSGVDDPACSGVEVPDASDVPDAAEASDPPERWLGTVSRGRDSCPVPNGDETAAGRDGTAGVTAGGVVGGSNRIAVSPSVGLRAAFFGAPSGPGCAGGPPRRRSGV